VASLSRTTWVSQCQVDESFWVLMKQVMTGWQWHQLEDMQIICALLHILTDYSCAITLSLIINV